MCERQALLHQPFASGERNRIRLEESLLPGEDEWQLVGEVHAGADVLPDVEPLHDSDLRWNGSRQFASCDLRPIHRHRDSGGPAHLLWSTFVDDVDRQMRIASRPRRGRGDCRPLERHVVVDERGFALTQVQAVAARGSYFTVARSARSTASARRWRS